MSLSLDKSVHVFAAALELRGERMRLLSENLVNADTPNYKARDIDFQQALRQQIGEIGPSGAQLRTAGTEPQAPKTTDPRHFSLQGVNNSSPELMYRIPAQPSLDGNTVETHREQAAFAENSIHYQAGLTFLGRRLNGLVEALRGE